MDRCEGCCVYSEGQTGKMKKFSSQRLKELAVDVQTEAAKGRASSTRSLVLNEAANALATASQREQRLSLAIKALIELLGDDLTDLIASIADERIRDHKLYDHGSDDRG